jgi:uncharacterized protein with beta-barrel porin domain
MGWFERSSRAGETTAAKRAGRVLAAGLVLVTIALAQPAWAQSFTPPPTPPPPPPTPSPAFVSSDLSAGAALANLGSNFLERLGDQASGGFPRASRSNPGGGGASAATDDQNFRSWAELYEISSRTGPQGGFVGDRRQTLGGVAGFGARVAPGVNVGFSIDQSGSAIDAPLAMQSASLDLTQLGFNASVDRGPWTWAIALVHGFGKIDSNRDTGAGIASAAYRGRVDGALTELSYYWTADQSRIVPKAAFEFVHAATGSFQEMGGLDPVSATGATLDRSRLLLGAEIGHSWIVDRKILDLSAYGKFVDNLEQVFNTTTISLGPQSITLQGIGESRLGADAGAALSISLSNTARLYLNYDGKFRSAFQSHQGTMGVELKW